ncbi:hypothetical protein [Oceanithermus sp.]
MDTNGFGAKEALREASAARGKAEKVLTVFSGRLLVLWGSVYLVMYGGGAMGWAPPWLWLPLDAAAFALSFALGSRVGEAFRTEVGSRLRRIWLGFGGLTALTLLAFMLRGTADPLFSFVVNQLVAFALVESGQAMGQRGLVRGGWTLAVVNALFFALWPDAYPYALAGMGALAVAAGLGRVR